MPRQAAEFATHRPSYWREYAAAATQDLRAYGDFVHDYVPAPGHWLCFICSALGEGPRPRACPQCDNRELAEYPSHHDVIIERLLYGDRLELILAPPDTGKTSWGVVYAEWVLGRNPNWRWLVASEVAGGIATAVVTQVGETIASNERFHAVFGQLRDPAGHGEWSSLNIRLRTYISQQNARRMRQAPTPPPPWPWLSPRGRRPGLAHPNMKAVGWRTGYTGVRAEGIIADDICSDKTARSVVMSEAIFRTIHQKLLARLTGPDQRAIFFGQTWAPRDPYAMIREKAVTVYDNNPEREGMWALEREQQEPAA